MGHLAHGVAGHHTSHGFSTTWKREAKWHTLSHYIKGGGVLPPSHQLFSSFLSSPFSLSLSLVWFPKFGACTQGLETWDIGEVSTIRTTSCCWTPGLDLFSSAALLDRSPGDVVHTVCVRVL